MPDFGFVTKAKPINSIDSRCHVMKPESSITYITAYSGFISRESFLIAWGTGTHTHTHMHTNVRTKVIRRIAISSVYSDTGAQHYDTGLLLITHTQ